MFSEWGKKCRRHEIECFATDGKAIHFADAGDDGVYRFELALGRRYNLKSYFHFLDHFAPALLGVKVWRMKRTKGNFDSLLTIGDEAFLLTVLDGNWKRWEYRAVHIGNANAMKETPVSTTCCSIFGVGKIQTNVRIYKLPKYTYAKTISNQQGQTSATDLSNSATGNEVEPKIVARRGGSGWKEGGKAMLNVVYDAVKAERESLGAKFDAVVSTLLKEEAASNADQLESRKRKRDARIVVQNDL